MNSAMLSSDQALQLDNQICFALYSATHAMTKAYKPHLDALGLTYPQYIALLALWEQDGVTVSELGQRLYLDSGTLTPLLKRMEQGGLVQRLRDTADERRVLILLTPGARRLKARAASIPACMLQSMQCSLRELQRLTREVQTLRDRLHA